jgi:hypothetical protein
MQSDTEYFRNRAREERYAAEKSSNPTVRKRHLEFAEAYEGYLRDICVQDRRSALHLVQTGSFVGIQDLLRDEEIKAELG